VPFPDFTIATYRNNLKVRYRPLADIDPAVHKARRETGDDGIDDTDDSRNQTCDDRSFIVSFSRGNLICLCSSSHYDDVREFIQHPYEIRG
jgi:hypothetical protein